MHAVVIGGSLAGLCAARALADHAERVTVVDRDRFPDEPVVRKGVPQAHHLHVLITSGQRALDRLFPDLIAELGARGAVPVAAHTDVLYLSATGWRERFPATHQLVGASRELIDWTGPAAAGRRAAGGVPRRLRRGRPGAERRVS